MRRYLPPILALVLVALTVAAPLAMSVHAQDTGVVLATPAWKTLNPLTYRTVYDDIVLGKIYDTLVKKWVDGVTIKPELAASWEFKHEGNNKVLVFHLRKDVVWHDGQPLTADDVVYTINLVRSKPQAYIAPSKYVYEGLLDVTEPDKYTVELTYDATKAAADRFLLEAFTTLYIVPKHVWEKLSDTTTSLSKPEDMIGCGPFKVIEVKPGQYVKLVAFDKYFRGKPEVDSLLIKVVSDRNTFAMMVNTGEVDAGYFYFFGKLLESLQKTVANNPNIKIYRCPSTSIHMLVLNTHKSFFQNVEFRRAIAYAINVTAIVTKYYGKDGAILGTMGFLGPRFGNYSYYVPKEKVYPYNPDLAKKILDKLGYKDVNGDGWRETSDGKPLVIDMITRAPGDSFFRDAIADEIANYLAKVGIKVQVEKLASSVYWSRWGKMSYDMAIVGYVPGSPLALSWFTTGDPGNVVKYSNPVYDALVSKFITSGDPKYAWEAEKILIKECFLIGLYHPIVATPYRVDKFKDWVASPVGLTAGYWSVLGSKLVLGKAGPVEFSAQALIKNCHLPTKEELVKLNPDLAGTTPTVTTVTKTSATTIVKSGTTTVYKTTTVTETKKEVETTTVTTTVAGGTNTGLIAGAIIVGIIIGLIIGFAAFRRK